MFTAKALVLTRSDAGDGGWSLHPPGTTDDQIMTGEVVALRTGDDPNGPTAQDYSEALALLQGKMRNQEIAARVARAPNAKALEELLDELAPNHEFSVYQSTSRHFLSVLYRCRVEGQGANVRMARTTICEGSFWDIRATLVRYFEELPD